MKTEERIVNYLNGIIALAKQSNDENTAAIVMFALEAERLLFKTEEAENENN